MGNGIQQNLSGLYTLRAGLSVIIQEKEITDSIIKNASNEKEKAVLHAESKKEDLKLCENSAKKKYEEAILIHKNCLIKQESDEQTARSTVGNINASSYLASGILWLLLTVFLFALALAFIVIFCLCFKDCVTGRDFDMQAEKVQFGLGIAFLILGLPLAAGCIALIFANIADERMPARISWNFSKYRKAKLEKKNREKNREECKNNYGANLQAVKVASKNIVDAKEAYGIAQKNYIEACKTYEIEIAEINKNHDFCLQEANNHIGAALTVYNCLHETFRELIDERDWADLDLIIYYFETRRAESMKEALQLVDQERHTDRIANAVSRASQEICRTMDISISRLQNDMRKCFNVLSNQIVMQTQILVNEIGALREQTAYLADSIKDQNSYIQNLTSVTNMNNALLAKQNITSTQMLSEIEQIRNNSDYVSWRVRNGY